MVNYRQKLVWAFLGAGLVLPTSGFSASLGDFANVPLFLDSSEKPNIIVGLDDSASMHWEILTDYANGLFYVVSGKFANGGEFYPNSDKDFGYIFPNGRAEHYYDSDGKMYGDRRAVPPFEAYAFARSAEYNKGYYDPSETYNPWPVKEGGVTSPKTGDNVVSLGDAPVTLTPFDPFVTAGWSLFTTHTPNKAGFGFGVLEGMWCNNDGDICTENNDDLLGADVSNVPATYYIKNKDASYTYELSGPATTSTSLIVEAEDAVSFGTLFKKGSDLNNSGLMTNFAEIAAEASGDDFVTSEDKGRSIFETPPLSGTGEVLVNIPLSGSAEIWVRRRFPSANSDSLWMSLEGKGDVEIDVSPSGNFTWVSSDGYSWNKWNNGFATSNNWVWQKWADVSLSGTDLNPEVLRIRYREDGAAVDQIFVTLNGRVPAGKMIYDDAETVARSCGSESVTYSDYEAFLTYPENFDFGDSGITALAPDGSCLQKVVLNSAEYSDEDIMPSGRKFNAERQNFANWFMYHRRRHQTMRGAVAHALKDFSGVRVSSMMINSRDSDVTMYDINDDTEASAFFSEVYNAVGGADTPLRESLEYIGQQYERNDVSAPIISSCQKNFALLFTDGFNTGSVSGYGNADGSAGVPFADSSSNTLADVAHTYYWKDLSDGHDGIVPGLVPIQAGCDSIADNDIPASALDCNANPHMNSYMVGLGVKGTVFDGTTYAKVSDAHENPPTWPSVGGSPTPEQVDDMYHAAVNSRGEMYSTDSSSGLAKTLEKVVISILNESASASGVTFNSSSLQTDSVLFAATFDPKRWSGDLMAINLDPVSGDIIKVADNQGNETISTEWSASDKLANKTYTDRFILTFDPASPRNPSEPASTRIGKAVPFEWDNLTDFQQQDLGYGLDLNLPVDVELAKKRLNFIKGNTADEEEEAIRKRFGHILGDIVDSAPVYVGPPSQNFPNSWPFPDGDDAYTEFVSRTNRDPVVYVGANDGMLHGFDGKTGEEVFAYIPNLVFDDSASKGLHYLADPNYSHRYYVDQTPIVADVYIDAKGNGNKAWHTILIGGLRGGGKGLFALDITDPSKFTSGNTDLAELVLWEYSGDTDTSLGQQVTTPTVSFVENSDGTFGWYVIFGNGYNSTDNTTQLMMLSIDGGADGTWDAEDVIKIDTEATDSSSLVAGGLSGVAVADLDNDRVTDRAYAGDINGNIWAFDLDIVNSADEPKVAYKGGGTPLPLFTAANGQPIMAAPNLSRHPTITTDNSNDPNVIVAFGTGRYLLNGDQSDLTMQSFYAIWDSGDDELDRTNLVERQIIEDDLGTLDKTDDTRKLVDPNDPNTDLSNGGGASTIDPWASAYGWYIDLVARSSINGSAVPEGERMINKPLIRNDFIVFNTIVPNLENCLGGGASWTMVLSLFDAITTANVIDVDDNGEVDTNDKSQGKYSERIGNNPNLLGQRLYNTDDSGAPQKTELNLGTGSVREGRLGWREVFQE